jgi:hypothetical protein
LREHRQRGGIGRGDVAGGGAGQAIVYADDGSMQSEYPRDVLLRTNVVIWSSGIGTVRALMGLMAGISLYSPSKRYSFEGTPAAIPYAGQKRLHMILGLFFGILARAWASSGMLSMDPFPVTKRGPRSGAPGAGGRGASPAARIQAALRADRFQMGRVVGEHSRIMKYIPWISRGYTLTGMPGILSCSP